MPGCRGLSHLQGCTPKPVHPHFKQWAEAVLALVSTACQPHLTTHHLTLSINSCGIVRSSTPSLQYPHRDISHPPPIGLHTWEGGNLGWVGMYNA